MSNVSFHVGEVVWAKIRGYPHWPAIITGTEDDNKEKKYAVSFIGDNTHSSLAKKYLVKFEKGLQLYANTKKKNLAESIEKAKEIYSNKNGIKEQEMKAMINNNLKYKEKEKEKENEREKEKHLNHNNNSNNNNKEKNVENYINKKRLKKIEDKTENELIYRICKYLKHITAILMRKEINYNFEKNKENLCRICKFLAEYKMQEPIEFLKKSNMGKYIKYINENVENDEIKQAVEEVYKNLEGQVLSQLLKQK
jgi:hypothetical protein